MKLLLYSHYFAPSIGGVETMVMSLARGLAELRTADGAKEVELSLVTQTPRGDFDDSALPFRVVRRPGLWTLLKLVRKSDVVHVAGPALLPVSLGSIVRRPVVVEHHGFQVICPTGQLLIESRGEPCPGHFMAGRRVECWKCDPALSWFGARELWLLTFLRRWLCKHVAVNIMPTNWLGEQLKLPRATTIHHGLTQIQPVRPAPADRTGIPVLAFQGRLVSTKGAGILLEAAKMLRAEGCEFRLVIIGDGPARAKLEAVAKEPLLLGRVEFTGKLAGPELDKVLQHASMVVVPSLGGEVFGLVLAENMQRGLPVIASNLGAFQEILNGAGRTFAVGDPTDLAAGILAALREPDITDCLAIKGREQIVKLCDRWLMIKKHFDLYSLLVSAR